MTTSFRIRNIKKELLYVTLVPSGKVRFCDITGIVSLEMECEAIRYGHTKKKGNINNKNLQNPCELRKISSRVILIFRGVHKEEEV